jgi:hypothetical protein
MAQDTFRKRVVFWLDLLREDEYRLMEKVAYWKHTRQFASAMRDGIRLIADLREGRIDVLLELFPWVRSALMQVEAPATSDALQHQLQRLEQLILQQGMVPVAMPPRLGDGQPAGPKALDVPRFDLPIIEDADEDDTVILKRDTSTSSAMNFINSMLNLQQ